MKKIALLAMAVILAGTLWGCAGGEEADKTAPTISGVSASDITQASATISWNTDEPATSQVEYGLTTSYGSTTLLASTLITSHSVSLSGLSVGTTYHYRVKSKDAEENERISGDYTFTTATPDTTPPVVSGVSASDITTSAATISWATDELATSQVEYGVTTSYGSTSPLDSSLVTSHSVSLSGLSAGTTYHYRVKSKDAEENEAISADNTFATTQPVTGVSLNKSSATILMGETELLNVTIEPSDATNQNVTWSSADNAIASVLSSGLVTAIGVGTTTITVTTEDGSFTDSCMLIVEPISVTGVSLNKSSATVAAGLSEQLIATIEPPDATNQNVTWSSADSTIASVTSSGLVTGVAVGTTVVTVTTEDQGFTGNCTITVTEAELVSLSISPKDTSIEIGETLEFHVLGTYTDSTTNDLTSNVMWFSSNNEIASISNVEGSKGIVTALAEGTVSISAQLDEISDSTALQVTKPYFSEIGVPYVAEDGLTVTLHSLTIIEKIGSYEYTISYTLTNNTPDQVIDEGTFKMYYASGGGQPQYGFFGRLFPGDTINRTYTFEELKSNPFDVLEYHSDNFFSDWPIADSLKWKVEIP